MVFIFCLINKFLKIPARAGSKLGISSSPTGKWIIPALAGSTPIVGNIESHAEARSTKCFFRSWIKQLVHPHFLAAYPVFEV